MKAAECDQVVELRLTALGPVLDMMTLGETRAIAAGVAAAAVACFQRAGERRRDAARFAADIERVSVFAFDDTDDRRIAREPSRRVERKRGAILQLAEGPSVTNGRSRSERRSKCLLSEPSCSVRQASETRGSSTTFGQS